MRTLFGSAHERTKVESLPRIACRASPEPARCTRERCERMSETKKKTKRSRRKQRMHVHVQRATRTCFRLCECVCCWGHRSGRIAKRVTRMKCLARANTIYIRLSNFVPIFVLTLNVSSDSTYGDLRTCVRGEEVRLYILVATPTYYKLYCPWLLSK